MGLIFRDLAFVFAASREPDAKRSIANVGARALPKKTSQPR